MSTKNLVKVDELLSAMALRLQMIEDGTIAPPAAVANATGMLVTKLRELAASGGTYVAEFHDEAAKTVQYRTIGSNRVMAEFKEVESGNSIGRTL